MSLSSSGKTAGEQARLIKAAASLTAAGVLLLLVGCAPPADTSLPTVDATSFIATRVVEVLTQNAATNAAPATPGPALTATPIPVVLLSEAAGATITPPSAPEATLTPATPCAEQACADGVEHFWFDRPVPGDAAHSPDRTYPYGSTAQGLRETHHGVEFEAPAGTPVLAAGPGTVIVAGDDAVTAYGPATRFYGNLVVVEHGQRHGEQPVYTLYGHLKTVAVTVGQAVEAGDLVGTVGSTGIAIGAHLHFEVRVGQNTYDATRNPELWLKPLVYDGHPWGAIAGRVVDTDGNLVSDYAVVIRPIATELEGARHRYLTTYARGAVNGDDRLQENFAIGDMPVGTYTVSVNTTTLYRQTVAVASNRITWVTFVVKPPVPTPTATPAP